MAPAEAPGDSSIMTCTACRLRLRGVTARNEHYRSELHMANLRRKVAGVAPYTEEEFQQVQARIKGQQVASKRGAAPQWCEVCSKKFSSVRALENHCNSRRHQDAARGRPMSEVTESAAASVASDDEPLALAEADLAQRIAEAAPVPPTACVFDGRPSASLAENVAYMASRFGFVVPYADALADLEGLLAYLGDKVGIGYCCVECDRPFASVAAVRRHMIDKQHCCMTDDSEFWLEEYGEFYDFAGDGGDDDADDGGWEEVPDDEVSALDVAEPSVGTVVVAGALGKVGPMTAGPAVHNADEVSMSVNGKVLGHRSLQRYYKQSYPKSESREAVLINKVNGENRLLGWRGSRKLPAEVRAARVQSMRKFKFDLQVGRSNYYTRKAGLKPSMAVFNSGYRP